MSDAAADDEQPVRETRAAALLRHAYTVRHETHYAYAASVTLARHILHLTPRACAWQAVDAHALHVVPQPDTQRDDHDPFGNPITRLSIARPHREFAVVAESAVSVAARPPVVVVAAAWADAPAWQDTVDGLGYRGGLPLAATQYRFESPHVRIKSDLAALARPFMSPHASLFALCSALNAYIHASFTYDPDSTEVGTSVLEVLRTRRGVCQDFAHLMIAVLRSVGLAARYVSGYLLTEPPPGSPRLVGADASHAWVAVYFPEVGGEGAWIEFDPTNGCLADHRYITLGWGRDFGDVSPLRGVILGGGEHTLSVAVTVAPADEAGVAAEVEAP